MRKSSHSSATLLPLDDLELACSLLCQVTGDNRGTVLRRLRAEQQRLGANVNEDLRRCDVQPHVWSEGLVDFYSSTDSFLFESLIWNRQTTKQAIRNWICRWLRRISTEPLRVLLYGDGLGFDSAAIASEGHQTTYFEVGRQSQAFARKVFELNDVQVRMIDQPDSLSGEQFDVTICLDVLEHVPDPPDLVRQLAGLTRPGGDLIINAPFWYIHPDVPTHLLSNARHSGCRQLFCSAGLECIDAGPFWTPLALRKTSGERSVRIPMAARMRLFAGAGPLHFGRRFPRLMSRIFSGISRLQLRQTAGWLKQADTGAAD